MCATHSFVKWEHIEFTFTQQTKHTHSVLKLIFRFAFYQLSALSNRLKLSHKIRHSSFPINKYFRWQPNSFDAATSCFFLSLSPFCFSWNEMNGSGKLCSTNTFKHQLLFGRRLWNSGITKKSKKIRYISCLLRKCCFRKLSSAIVHVISANWVVYKSVK